MDAYCGICREPWDSYGARHGDMEPWEFELFRKGVGCPCCKGEGQPIPADDPAWVGMMLETDSALEGDDDAMYARAEIADGGARLAWQPPPDKILLTCDKCGRKLMQGPNRESTPYCDPNVQTYSYSHREACNDPDYWQDHPSAKGKPVCPDCFEFCDDCREIYYRETDDIYNGGGAYLQSAQRSLCIGCLETNWCLNCESRHDDCTCCANGCGDSAEDNHGENCPCYRLCSTCADRYDCTCDDTI